MSDAWMPFQPAMDEPSNAWPSSNFSMPTYLAGTPTCCSLPRVSVKRKSTNLTSWSLIIFNTSFADIDITLSPKNTKINKNQIKQRTNLEFYERRKCANHTIHAHAALCHRSSVPHIKYLH